MKLVLRGISCVQLYGYLAQCNHQSLFMSFLPYCFVEYFPNSLFIFHIYRNGVSFKPILMPSPLQCNSPKYKIKTTEIVPPQHHTGIRVIKWMVLWHLVVLGETKPLSLASSVCILNLWYTLQFSRDLRSPTSVQMNLCTPEHVPVCLVPSK